MRFLLNGTKTPTDKFVLKQESSMAFTWKQGKPAREPRSRPNGLRSFLHSKYFSFGCRFWLLLTFKTLEQARDSKKKDLSTFFCPLVYLSCRNTGFCTLSVVSIEPNHGNFTINVEIQKRCNTTSFPQTAPVTRARTATIYCGKANFRLENDIS